MMLYLLKCFEALFMYTLHTIKWQSLWGAKVVASEDRYALLASWAVYDYSGKERHCF